MVRMVCDWCGRITVGLDRWEMHLRHRHPDIWRMLTEPRDAADTPAADDWAPEDDPHLGESSIWDVERRDDRWTGL